MYSLLAHPDSRVEPVPGFKRVALLQVNLDRTVHILNLLFSVPVGPYSTARRIIACRGEPTSEGLPPLVDLPMEDIGVRRSVRAVQREEHISHLEGVTPFMWKST